MTRLGIAVLISIVFLIGGMVLLRRRFDAQGAESTLARIKRSGVARIGYANEAPYGYIDTATGEITGEAPEIAREIFRRMGVHRVEPVVTEFGALIPALKARRFDLIAAGMYITSPRCEQVAFSNPTYRIGEAFVVRRGNPLDLHSFADVAAHPSATIGFVGGTVEHGYAREAGIPNDRMMLFPDNISALTAVKTGRIDAAVATRLTVHDLLSKTDTDGLEQAEPFTNPVVHGKQVYGYGAFAFRKEDQELREAFNRHLDELIGSQEHLRLTRPFGITRETLPGDVTAKELCRK